MDGRMDSQMDGWTDNKTNDHLRDLPSIGPSDSEQYYNANFFIMTRAAVCYQATERYFCRLLCMATDYCMVLITQYKIQRFFNALHLRVRARLCPLVWQHPPSHRGALQKASTRRCLALSRPRSSSAAASKTRKGPPAQTLRKRNTLQIG